MKAWVRRHWRAFLMGAVARDGGIILRANGVKDVRAALEQSLWQIDRIDGPLRRSKGKLKEVVRRTLEVWDEALPWTPDGGMTAVDRKVTQAIMK